MIASETGVDLARLLLDLLIIVSAAKLAAELVERLRIPAVLGEILAGVAIGPSGFGLVELGGDRGVSLGMLAEIGVLLLLLQVGMEMDLKELGKVGKASLLVAIIGVVVPFASGAGVGLAFGLSTNTAIFIGAALTATSVGITARVFGDLRALATTEARIVLGAAVADDVLGLVILTVVVKVVTGGSVGVGTIASTLGLAIGFLLLTGIVGIFAVPKVLDTIHRRSISPATVTVAALVVTIGFAELADSAKLAFIIGAFMAGLGLGRSKQHDRIARDLGAVGNILIPVFFAQIGINTDLEAMFKPSVLGLAAVLSVVAVLGKLAAALGTFGTPADKLLVGLGMIPRGEVGLIFAAIGLSNGVLDADQYGGLILVVLLTTVITPPLLRWRLGQAAPTVDLDTTAEPQEGWLTIAASRVQLNGVPPVDLTVPLALRTAGLTTTATPSDHLLDWFGTHRIATLSWDQADTAGLLRLLRDDNPRAWRFLDLTGVLERALPEVASAMARRRADLGDLDPMAALRFQVVDRLDSLAHQIGLPSDDLVIAALVADVCEDTARSEGECASSLARRLVPDDEAEHIVAIIADAHMLRAGTREPHAFDRTEILQLATHLASSAHARDAHTLALALGGLPIWQREALDERLRLVVEALEHPEVTGSEANNLAGARRLAAEHLLAEEAPIERLRFATNSYLLSHEPEELARQARLVEPLPRAGTVRVSVTPMPEPDRWKVDVACRDTDGLLAHLAEVFTTHGLPIAGAGIATWPDGAVLDSFEVITSSRPAARQLALAFEAKLKSKLTLVAMPGLTLEFDNAALPWHTSILVSGPDRLGVLQAVTAAFAAADVVVHTARVATTGDTVSDRFAVSDRVGRKLADDSIERIRRTLADGAAPRRRGRKG
ncbi:MAG: cation:proton antiporter [Actinomycetota bacterium]|nr:cation:proton antiporter [Actinomycetota bacterium]